MRGKFITFEGCEGSGKSTQVRLFTEYLKQRNIAFLSTREPGGDAISEQIRKIILSAENTEMTDECEALLYSASRVQHLKNKIEPALSQGKLVVCDRYIDSSYAYQGYARGLSIEFIEKINSFAIDNYTPDATIFLNMPSEKGFSRKHGADADDRIEQAGEEFHKKVYNGYVELAKKYPERIIEIDCLGSKEETKSKILFALKSRGII